MVLDNNGRRFQIWKLFYHKLLQKNLEASNKMGEKNGHGKFVLLPKTTKRMTTKNDLEGIFLELWLVYIFLKNKPQPLLPGIITNTAYDQNLASIWYSPDLSWYQSSCERRSRNSTIYVCFSWLFTWGYFMFLGYETRSGQFPSWEWKQKTWKNPDILRTY